MAKKPTDEELEQKVKTLQQSVEKYRLIVERTPTIIYIAELDEAGTTLYISPQVKEVLGFSQTEWLDDHDLWLKQLHPEDRDRVLEELVISHRGNNFSSEYRMITHDGQTVWLHDEAKIVCDADGKPLYLQGSMLDITKLKLVEKALYDSQHMLKIVLDSIPSGVFWKNCDLFYVGANKTWLDSVGLNSSEEVAGKSDYDLLWTKEQADSFRKHDRKVLESGIPEYNIIESYLKADGTQAWAKTNKIPLQDVDGTIIGILGSYEDITEHKKAEEELQRQRNFFKMILETTPDLLVLKDTNFVYQAANSSFCKYLGKPMEEVIGKTDYDLFPVDEAEMYRRDDDKVMKSLKPLIQDEEISGMEDKQWFHIAKTPVFDNNKNFTGILCSVRNISDRKQAEDALKKYESIVSATQEHMSFVDKNYVYKAVNDSYLKAHNKKREEILGFSVSELLGTRLFEEIVKGLLDRCLAGEEIHYESWFDFPELGKRYMDVAYYPFFEADGSISGIVVSSRDITDRKKAEEGKKRLEAQLQEARKMEAVGTLAGGIAHDFNNLLTTVQGNASLMLYDIDSTHPHYEMLEEIIKQSRSGAELTAQLLGYARKGRYEVKPINLNRVVEKTSNTFGRIHKEIRIHQELAEDLFGIKADQSQIEQVLLNLCINAAAAMPRSGMLTLKSTNVTHEDMKNTVYDTKPGRYVLLTVTDTGTGMDEETRERIFEPFFTTKEMGRGTGLGLASVYGIIKGHGGYIDVASEKGRGTTFRIYLPASDKKIETVAKTAEQIAKGIGTILFADDEAVVLKIGIKMLEKLGYTALEAKSGIEAIEIYKANKDKIDLVILDMIMPDMGGGEAYDRMKEINPNVKVLLSSGYSIEGQATEILERGCNAFIQKPFNMTELTGAIREFFDKK